MGLRGLRARWRDTRAGCETVLDDAEAMAGIRLQCRALGCPVDDVSDEELRAGVARLAAAALSAGYTFDQATAALSPLHRAAEEMPVRGVIKETGVGWPGGGPGPDE